MWACAIACSNTSVDLIISIRKFSRSQFLRFEAHSDILRFQYAGNQALAWMTFKPEYPGEHCDNVLLCCRQWWKINKGKKKISGKRFDQLRLIRVSDKRTSRPEKKTISRATIWENIVFPKAQAPVYMDDPSYRLAAMKIPRESDWSIQTWPCDFWLENLYPDSIEVTSDWACLVG